MAFQKGKSGNPADRPPGSPSWTSKMRKDIEAMVPEVVGKLRGLPADGDTAPAKLLLDRCLPPLRPTGCSVYARPVLLFATYAAPQRDQHSIRVGEADTVRLGDQAEQRAVAVEAPGAPLLDDFQSRLDVAVE